LASHPGTLFVNLGTILVPFDEPLELQTRLSDLPCSWNHFSPVASEGSVRYLQEGEAIKSQNNTLVFYKVILWRMLDIIKGLRRPMNHSVPNLLVSGREWRLDTQRCQNRYTYLTASTCSCPCSPTTAFSSILSPSFPSIWI
jgi:hypothetical protein